MTEHTDNMPPQAAPAALETELETHAPSRLSADERIAAGKKRRDAVSREAHAEVHSKQRRFDPVAVILASGKGRIRKLLPIRYARMKVSPFAFFRGSVSIMASDFARLPNSGLDVQLCGDAHIQNLGSFAAPDGQFAFDFNDFDETIPGPWEWDVKRMAASIVLAGNEAGHRRSSSRDAAELFVRTYCDSIAAFSRGSILYAARYQVKREGDSAPVRAAMRQSERATPLDLLTKMTEIGSDGERRFRDLRPRSWRVASAGAQAVLGALRLYRESLAPERRHLFDLFRPVDVGFKVAGTGSVGLRDYVVLLEGNGPRDPMFLQVKEQPGSAYAPVLTSSPRAVHQGRRVVEGQRAVQTFSDLMLGWTTIGPRDYLVRQLNDHKGEIGLELLRGAGLNSLAAVAGELLARGHARSGDACRVAGYCGSGARITKALTAFAVDYADLVEADYKRFVAAIRSGAISADSAPS